MPPEPLPWDRKDLGFRDRKHEKCPGSDVPGSGGATSSALRWRGPYHGPGDIPRTSPRRPQPGHYRHAGSYHQLYQEESGGRQEWMPSRTGDETSRPYSGRYGGGGRGQSIGSTGRESQGSFRRSPYWDTSSFSRKQQQQQPEALPLTPNPVTGPRSVAVPITSLLPSKDHHDNKAGDGADDGTATGHRTDPDRSLGSVVWKHLKWSRSGSLSLSKTARSGPDGPGNEALMLPGKENPGRSPELMLDESAPQKKQRLGWGEGLAKYERRNVEGSEDGSLKSGLMQCSNSAKSVVSDMSLRIAGHDGSACPMTPSSVACSSSPGMADKSCMKLAIIDNVTSHFSDPSRLRAQSYCEEEYILNSLLDDLLQPEDAYSGDSSCTKHTALSKLLVLKGDISKELEKIENDIDLFESVLQSLSCNEEIDLFQRIFSTETERASGPCEETAEGALKAPSSIDHVLSSLTVVVPEGSIIDSVASEKHHVEDEGEHAASVEMISSKVDGAVLLGKGVSDSDTLKTSKCPVKSVNDVSGDTETMAYDGEGRPIAVCGPDRRCLQAGNHIADANSLSGSKHGSNLVHLIMVSNRDSAKKSSQLLDRFMPTTPAQSDIFELNKILSCRNSGTQIKKKLAKRRRFMKFKEQVLAIRYRAAYHLWKEDLNLLSIKKQRPKSQKLFDFGVCLSLSGSQKHRSSLCPRSITAAGKRTLVPTTEMVDFTSKLLTESQIKIYRNSLKMPACILFEERRYSGFITNNGLIEDPLSFEKEREIINRWTPDEKELFMEMLATFGKNFTKIASFLKHKTTADCIEFFYKNHKSESFVEVKKRLNLKKQSECLPTNTYLMTSGKKWKHEVNAASFNLLGAVAVLPVCSNDISRVKQIYNRRHISGSSRDFKMSRRSYGLSERKVRHKREVAANVLVGLYDDLSSEAIGSSITGSIDPAEKANYKRSDQPLTAQLTQSIDEEENCSDEGCGELDSVDWTDEEKSRFMKALGLFGKDFGSISKCVRSRSKEQCKIFFSKARKCLGLEAIQQGTGSGGTPRSDANDGGCDTEDVCEAERDFGICSTHSFSKVDTGCTQSVANTSSKRFVHAGKAFMHCETERSNNHYGAGGLDEDGVETEVDKLALELNEGKLASKGENSQSCAISKDVGDTAVRFNNSFVLSEVPNLVGKTEVRKEVDSPSVSPVEPCISSCMELEQVKSHSAAKVQPKSTEEDFPADLLEVVNVQQVFIPKIEVEGRHEMEVFGSDVNNNILGNMVNLFPYPMISQIQHQFPSVHLPYAHKQSISFKQKNPQFVPPNSLLPDPSSICSGDHSHNLSGSTLDFEKHGNKQKQRSLTRGFHQHNLLGYTSLNQVDQPMHILRGSAPQVLEEREMKKEPNLVRKVLGENNLKKNGVYQQDRFSVSDSHTEKCSGSRFSHTRSVIVGSRSEEHLGAQLRPHSQSACSENEVNSNRTGDVKLFGKVLSHRSSLQKYNSFSLGNNSRLSCPKQGGTSPMKLPNMVKGTTIAATMAESSGNLGVEEVPLRSYGFWDGHRMQTGYLKLQESPGGVSFYSQKDGLPCNNGVLAGYQEACMQELHKRSGFERVLGLQEQSRTARLGMNLVSGGGFIVGGGGDGCTGVSDPMTATALRHKGRDQY